MYGNDSFIDQQMSMVSPKSVLRQIQERKRQMDPNQIAIMEQLKKSELMTNPEYRAAMQELKRRNT